MPSEVGSPLRLRPGLAVAPSASGLVVEGGRRRCVFRGDAASDFLPRLMAALDGTRSLDEVCAEVGLANTHLRQAIDLLDRHGLVEPVPSLAVGQPATAEVDAHLSRAVNKDGHYACAGEYLEALGGSAVHLIGDPQVTDRVSADLKGCGVGVVTSSPEPPSPVDQLASDQVSQTLVVVVDDTANGEQLARAVDWSLGNRIPALRVAAVNRHLEIGPTFVADATPCPRCLQRDRADAGWGVAADADATTVELLAAMTADTVVAILGRSPRMPHRAHLMRIAIADWLIEQYYATGSRDCGTCRSLALPDDEQSALVVLFEERIEHASEIAPRDDGSRTWLSRMNELLAKRPEYPGHPRRPCSPTDVRLKGTFGDPAAQCRELDHSALAEIVRRVAGARDATSRDFDRWTPSGGNLGSVEPYVVTEAGIHGVPGTIFRYDDLEHDWIAVRPDDWSLQDVLVGTDLVADSTDAVIAFAATHSRIADKYRDFAYHLVPLDAGCAATQLAAVAGGLGLAVDFASCWDERVGESLCIDPAHQYVTVIAVLRPRPA